jgi:hypothetical protein
MLAEWLKAQWVECDYEAFPLHKGLFEARYEYASFIAEMPADASADEKLARLYQRLSETLTRTDSPEDDDPE